MLLTITQAKYLHDYLIKVTFNNGEERTVDFFPISQKYTVFKPLENKNVLKNFQLTDTLEWENSTIDIAPEYLYSL